MSTTIQISEDLQQELNRRKIFSRETYEDIIWDMVEDAKEISEETKKEISEGRTEIAKGHFITLSDLKKKYGMK
jgi:predicted transcriptional regulator